jgi:hypothetical protein
MNLDAFLLGAVAQASLIVALFFWRYWRKTGDRFFVLFTFAFLVDAMGRAALALYGPVPQEQEPFFYLTRLVTFGLILAAIADKNVRSRKHTTGGSMRS